MKLEHHIHKVNKMSTEEIIEDTLSGNAHFHAWSEICNVLDEVTPGWCSDVSKAPVTQAVEKIRELASR